MSCYKASAISRKEIQRYIRCLKKMVHLEHEMYFPVVQLSLIHI